MFKVVKERKIWWPVKVMVPVNGGDAIEETFEMLFLVRNVDGNRDLLTSAPDASPDGAPEQALSETYADFVAKLALDFRKVQGEDGQSLTFGRETLALLMAMPGVFIAVLEAYRSCTLAEVATKRGN